MTDHSPVKFDAYVIMLPDDTPLHLVKTTDPEAAWFRAIAPPYTEYVPVKDFEAKKDALIRLGYRCVKVTCEEHPT